MDVIKRYAKGIVAIIAAAALATYTVANGGDVDQAVTIAVAVLGAFGVVMIPNAPKE